VLGNLLSTSSSGGRGSASLLNWPSTRTWASLGCSREAASRAGWAHHHRCHGLEKGGIVPDIFLVDEGIYIYISFRNYGRNMIIMGQVSHS
jgi:hypothetical protein